MNKYLVGILPEIITLYNTNNHNSNNNNKTLSEPKSSQKTFNQVNNVSLLVYYLQIQIQNVRNKKIRSKKSFIVCEFTVYYCHFEHEHEYHNHHN